MTTATVKNGGKPATKAVERVAQTVSAQPEPQTIDVMLQKYEKQLGMALPKHMNAERLQRIALTTLRLSPKLQECTKTPHGRLSFIAALFQSAQLGLEPNTMGESWIVPYNTKKGLMAQFQIGAYGLVKLYWQHQNSVSLQVESVHQHDFFEYNLASGEVKHIPPLFGKERGNVVGYYAYAQLSNGGRSLKVMAKDEVLEHAKRFSKCWSKKDGKFLDDTPWAAHFDAMAKKTVLIQLMKVLPKSIELQKALAADETIKTEVEGDMSVVPESVSYEDISSPDEPAETEPEQKKEATVEPTPDKAELDRLEKRFNELKSETENDGTPDDLVTTARRIEMAFDAGDITEAQRKALDNLIDKRQRELQK